MSAGFVVTTDGPAQVAVVRYPERQLIALTLPSRVVTVVSRGPQGPPGVKGDQGDPGPVGPPGGAYFTYSRPSDSPAATWVIDHNLNRKVQVTVLDLADTVVYADVTHGSLNQTTITFAQPFAGSALLG